MIWHILKLLQKCTLALPFIWAYSSLSASPAPQLITSPLAIPKATKLSNPSPVEVEKIIREFAAKEKLFKAARESYTYRQINRLQELNYNGRVIGTYEQSWDILYDDRGKRVERVTYAPIPTLQRIQVTQQDIEAMRSIQPFVLTTDELPLYEVKYLSHSRVDEITAYIFSIRPRKIEKGKQYFQGRVWVDDRDLQIVKSEGRQVPEIKNKKSENLFPRFVTFREQVDGKFWFPTYTRADDTLRFSSGPVRIRQIIKYTDYKQFRAKTRITLAGEVENLNSTKKDGAEP